MWITHATNCRALTKSARNQIDATMLEEMADGFDAEARRIGFAAKENSAR